MILFFDKVILFNVQESAHHYCLSKADIHCFLQERLLKQMASLQEMIQEIKENQEAECRIKLLFRVSMRFMLKIWLRYLFSQIIIQGLSIRHGISYLENM